MVFDPRRLIRDGAVFLPQEVNAVTPLSEALARETIKPSTKVVVAPVGERRLILHATRLAYSHIVHGTIDGVPWVVGFCIVCNTGNTYRRQVGDRWLKFKTAGVYNGMALLEDVQTGSYWDHITGECVHGEYRGERLENLGPLEHMTAGSADKLYKDALLATASYGPVRGLIGRLLHRTIGRKRGFLLPYFHLTMPEGDTRLPRMELGLGVWEEGKGCYYPMREITQRGGAVLHKPFDDRQLLVYVDPIGGHLAAIWTEAKSVKVELP